MRMSPARRSWLRKSAAKSVATGDAPNGRAGRERSPYREVLAELGECLRELKQIQARDAKLARKRDLIVRFDPWVKGVLDAHRAGAPAAQDDVVLTMMVWALDINRYDQALDLIEYVVGNDLAMPERYTRTAPTVVAEIAADNALASITQGEGANLEFLQLVEEATREKDMIDEVRAKLHKAIGLALLEIADDDGEGDSAQRAGGRRSALGTAIPHLKRALRLNTKVGVKKVIEQAERELAKAES